MSRSGVSVIACPSTAPGPMHPGTQVRHALCLLLCMLSLTGCFLRKPKPAPALPPPPAVAIETVSVPPPTHPTEPEPEPEVVETPTTPPPPPPPPRRPPRRRPAPTPAAPAPATTAAATPPPVDLGQLTTGGEANNAALRQGTEDLLRAQQRRLINLSSSIAAAHGEQVEQARLFLRQADDAWKKLDVEGARTLATKAKVILDEILQ